ncbi:MAG: hypothetical protein LBD07_00890, partial [Spirochaetaceae bacterium]|nr:hypothetical protein [Spirochaetaceae bacterium]
LRDKTVILRDKTAIPKDSGASRRKSRRLTGVSGNESAGGGGRENNTPVSRFFLPPKTPVRTARGRGTACKSLYRT